MTDWLLEMTLWTGMLFACARVADRLLASRLAPRARMILYAPVLLRPILPLDWSSPAGVIRHDVDLLPTPAPVAVTDVGSITNASFDPIPWVWAAVSVVLMLYWVRSWVAAARLRTSIPSGPQGVRNHPTMGPAVIGVFRPFVILPEGLRDDREVILLHEHAHISARDPLLSCALQVWLALLWPLFPLWLARARLHQLMELAADGRAAAQHGAKTVGAALVSLADRPRPRAALGVSTLWGLKERMVSLRHGHVRTPVGHALGTAALTVLIGAAGARAQAPPNGDVQLLFEIEFYALDEGAVSRLAGVPGLGATGVVNLRDVPQIGVEPTMRPKISTRPGQRAEVIAGHGGDEGSYAIEVLARAAHPWDLDIRASVPGPDVGIDITAQVGPDTPVVAVRFQEDGSEWLLVVQVSEMRKGDPTSSPE